MAIPKFWIIILNHAAAFALIWDDLLCILAYCNTALITLVSEQFLVIVNIAFSASSAKNILVSTHFFMITGIRVKISLSIYLLRCVLISLIRMIAFFASELRSESTNFNTSIMILWKVTGLIKACWWCLLIRRRVLRASNCLRQSLLLNADNILMISWSGFSHLSSSS